MGLIQKIFYFHVPSWIMMFLAVFVCGTASAIYLCKEKPAADRLAVASAELAVLFGLMGLTTGPFVGDQRPGGSGGNGTRVLTMALILELIFLSYMLLRAYGGPGSEKLAAGLALLRDGQRAVRLSLGEPVADDSSDDERICRACQRRRLGCSVPSCGAWWRS